jgi:hypothetical protein
VDILDPLSNEKFVSVLSEVVWGLHVYGRYDGKQSKAIKALSKRVPNYSSEVYNELLELSLKILAVTIEAVEKAPKSPKPGQKFAEYADVDMEYVMRQLRANFPEQSEDFLRSHISSAINWFYMR